MTRSWIFLINTFFVNTKNSFKLALTLFEDTHAKLAAEAEHDTDIALIYTDFKAFYFAYKELYAQKQSYLGIYEGQTLNFETVIGEMPQQVRRWEGIVRAMFIEDSPEERAIFPNKRNPFLQGSYEQRISAVETLSITLNTYPTLANVVNIVETYYNRLEGARLAQQKQEGQNDKLSGLLAKQHKITCEELYGVLGRLMHKFRYNPEYIGNFIEIGLLRSKSGTGSVSIFKGVVLNSAGQGVVGAIVRLVDAGFETTTAAGGLFEMEIESGNFDVEILAANYKTYSQKGIFFDKDQDTVLNITLTEE